ncbi:hypothetical protein KJ596_00825 [Patescibacteria group bacterium]|nr:hypothetical protein [Patescibacteria group bacterium]MBU1867863.1 hypothetical protein [Patescibacteria group bacterium]
MIIKLSGILSMVFAWVLVVIPGLHAGIDGKSQTISFATKNKAYRTIINSGLVGGGLLQILFLSYLVGRYLLSYFNLGVLMYLSTTIITISVAFFPEPTYPKIHKKLARYYFVVNPLSLMIIGLSIKEKCSPLFFASAIIPLLYFIGLIFLIKKYKTENALMQAWAFLLLSFWTAIATFQ